MESKQLFTIDGVGYNVQILQLTRKFSVMDTEKSGRTMNGEMYRDPVGTFYNYTMVVAARDGDVAALDAFWEAMSKPVPSHVCVFPYGQDTLTQKMYVTGGEQNLDLVTGKKNHWGDISINFIAMGPKVKV